MVPEYPLYHLFPGLFENLPRQKQPQPDSGQCLLCHLWQSGDFVELVLLCQSDLVVEVLTTTEGPLNAGLTGRRTGRI